MSLVERSMEVRRAVVADLPRPAQGGTPSRLKRAVNIEDLRQLAGRRLPRALFDFIDGAAENEVTAAANRAAFARWRLVARVGRDVSQRSLEVELFGRRYGCPILIAPTGMAGLHRGDADLHLARAAHRSGAGFILSTVSTSSIEEVAERTAGPLWFQLYPFRDKANTRRLVERAQAAGYEALVVTMDCAVAGQRERDPRNGLTVPLRPSWANLLDLMRRGAWLLDMARHGTPQPKNLLEAAGGRADGQALAAYMQGQLDPSAGWEDVAEVRHLWRGPLLVKGVLCAEDARLALAAGADGVVVSNHGGRQLDGTVPSLVALERVAEAVGGRALVLMDGGVRRGADAAKALALGARAVCTGRATLFGVAAAGEEGGVRALGMLRDELDRCLALMGLNSIGELTRDTLERAEREAPVNWTVQNGSSS